MKMRSAGFVFALAACALAACGGGGYSSPAMPMQTLHSATAPPQPLNVSSTTLAAMSGGNSYSATVSNTPGGMMMFNGQMASTSVLTVTVSENGTVLSTTNTTAYYLASPYTPLGLSGTTNGVTWMATVTSYTPFPAMLTVGTSGQLLTANYQDSLGNMIGNLTETYTVTADSSTAVFVNVSGAATINGTAITETLTYAVTSSGMITLAGVTITVNGTAVTFM